MAFYLKFMINYYNSSSASDEIVMWQKPAMFIAEIPDDAQSFGSFGFTIVNEGAETDPMFKFHIL